jgi:diaminopimelate decarboxylase
MQIDLIRKGVTLPYTQTGDIITIQNVGAYNVSQSMQFIQPRPAIVLIDGGQVEVVRRSETYQDLKRLEVVPERLKTPWNRKEQLA